MKLIKLTVLVCMMMGYSCRNKQQPQETTAIKVEIKKENGNYSLYRDGKPYQFNGAGLEFGDIKKLQDNGGNSIRTWRTDNGQETGQEVLDNALRHGCTVTMCLEMARERHGFDYDDRQAVAHQFNSLKQEVLKYKDHPALIAWAIGNELNLGYTNPKVYDAVNKISVMIHQLDPNHLTTTTTAGINQQVVDDIKSRAPDIDFLSIQLYGDLVNLPNYIKETNWTKPYMVTEWGAVGHWEVDKTSWGAPIENTSTEKAQYYLKGYQSAIAPYSDQCIGSYVFLWGQKQERTPTWYGMFLETGESTESIDAMYYLWNGQWPENRAPRVDSLKLDGKSAFASIYLSPQQDYSAEVFLFDHEGDTINFVWEIKPESTDLKEGGDFEITPQNIEGLFEQPANSMLTFTAPFEEGSYRLFVYAYDGNENAAHANIPFYVSK